MSSESDTDTETGATGLAHDDVLELDDDRFTADNVAVVTGVASGVGRATATAAATCRGMEAT